MPTMPRTLRASLMRAREAAAPSREARHAAHRPARTLYDIARESSLPLRLVILHSQGAIARSLSEPRVANHANPSYPTNPAVPPNLPALPGGAIVLTSCAYEPVRALAKRWDASPERLASANALDPDGWVYPGQRLIIPQ